MALRFMGGWETGTNLDTFTSVTCGTGSGVATIFRRGAQYSMCFTNSTDCAYYSFPDIEPELFIQVAVIFTERSNIGDYVGTLLKLLQGTGVCATLKINSSGGISAYWGDSLFLVGTGSTVLVQNRWYDLEIRIKFDPTLYVLQVKIDGVMEISHSGAPTTFTPTLVAHYQFEDGALTTDSAGTNTLTAAGSPVADAVDFKQGAASVDLEYGDTDYLKIVDSNLDSGFPLKDGDTTKCFTYCFWMKQESQATNPMYIVGKYGLVAGDRSFAILTYTNSLRIYWGYSDGNLVTEWIPSVTITNGVWYHIGIAVDGINKIMRLKVYDESTGIVTNASITTLANELWVGDAEFRVGARASDTSYRFDGKIDDLIICTGFLPDPVIDATRLNSSSGLTTLVTLGVDIVEIDSPTNYTLYLDDVVINDTVGTLNNSWPDNVHVIALAPRSDNTSQWTSYPYAPSHWQQVQTLGPNQGQITAGSTGLIEIFGVETTPVGLTGVIGVQAAFIGRVHPSYPAFTTLHSLIQVGSTVYESTDITLTKVGTPYTYTWDLNPQSGSTWTVDDLGNLKVGVKTIR